MQFLTKAQFLALTLVQKFLDKFSRYSRTHKFFFKGDGKAFIFHRIWKIHISTILLLECNISLICNTRKRLGVFVMYPTDGISKIQRQQMVTCDSPNVKVLGIDGNFDDCQRIVKSLLSDQTLKKKLLKNHSVVLNTANSINWGRILPQILFHMVSRSFNLHKFWNMYKHPPK